MAFTPGTDRGEPVLFSPTAGLATSVVTAKSASDYVL